MAQEEEKPKKRKHIRRISLTSKHSCIKKIVAPKKRTEAEKAKKSAIFSKYIINQARDRVSFLRYFPFVKNYISVKHDITKSDFDILLYLYNEDYFDFEYFYALVKLIDEKNFGHFKRYQLSGYIVKVEKSIRYPRAETKVVELNLYKMSTQAQNIIKSFYRYLTKLIEIDTASDDIFLVPEEAQKIINEFQRQIHNIKSKKQSPDRVVALIEKADAKTKIRNNQTK